MRLKTLMLIAVAGYMLGWLAGCDKPAPVVAPVALPSVAGPTTELEKMGAVKMTAPVVSPVATPAPAPVAKVVKVKHKAKKSKAELAAYVKASYNAARAECLRFVVGKKIDADVALGQVRDFGNVLQVPGMCQ